MEKQRKPLSTKKPPIPSTDHSIISNWIKNENMPAMQPLVQLIDALIVQNIPNAYFSLKWGNAFYGTPDLGWLIELGVYAKSMNIIFLNGANFLRKPLLPLPP